MSYFCNAYLKREELGKIKFNRLATYVNLYEAELSQSIKLAKRGVDIEELHRFRVSVKRIRAINKLLDTHASEPLKFASTIAPLYAIGGRAREAELNSLIAPDYLISEDVVKLYRKYQKGIVKKNKRRLKRKVKQLDQEKYDKRWKLLYAVVKGLSKKHLKKLVLQFIKKEIIAINAVDLASCEMEEIHTIRKRIKAIYFILRLLLELDIELVSDDELTEIKTFASRLGHWHDREVVYESLSSFKEIMDRCDKPVCVEDIDQAMHKIEQENSLFLSKLEEYLADFNTHLARF